MSADWKPGDVAVTPRGDRLFRHGTRWITERPGFNASKVAANHETEGARRLVVIDPEDAEQVERLTKALVEAAHRDGNFTVSDNGIHPDTTTRALREFANPTPRIEEPQGLGAVVVNGDARRFVRTCVCGGSVALDWRADGAYEGTKGLHWSAIDAVRVLSEGVTA